MIRNITKNKTLVNNTELRDSALGKSIGLMFRSRSQFSSKGIVFIFNMEKNRSFHMLFMNFSLDFLFLDSKRRVTKVVRNVKPWKLSVLGKGKYVIELPSGKSFNTEVGDVISFK